MTARLQQTPSEVGRLRWLAPVLVAVVTAAVATATAPSDPAVLATGRLVDVTDVGAAAEIVNRHVETEIDIDGDTLTVTGRHESPTVAALTVNRALAAAADAGGGSTAVPAPVPEPEEPRVAPATRGLVAGLVALVLTTVAVGASPALGLLRRRRPQSAAGDVADAILRHRRTHGTAVSSVVVAGRRPEDRSAEFASDLAAALAGHDEEVLLVEEDTTSGLLEMLLDLPPTETARKPVGGGRSITCSAAGLWGPTPLTTVLARKRLAEWTRSGTIAVVHVSPGADAESSDIWSRSADAVVAVEAGAPVLVRLDDRPARVAGGQAI